MVENGYLEIKGVRRNTEQEMFLYAVKRKAGVTYWDVRELEVGEMSC
jgi:hypothetical protein